MVDLWFGILLSLYLPFSILIHYLTRKIKSFLNIVKSLCDVRRQVFILTGQLRLELRPVLPDDLVE